LLSIPTPIQAAPALHILPGGRSDWCNIQSLGPEDLADAVMPLDYDVLIMVATRCWYLEALGAGGCRLGVSAMLTL